MRLSSIITSFMLLGLGACTIYPPTPNPDYTIHVQDQPNGTAVAVPPNCVSWVFATTDPYDNQPTPQLGCAQARNLAMMVENPKDLIAAPETGETRGTDQVGAIRRYDNNQTRSLIWTGADPNQLSVTTMSTPVSAITGDQAGAGGGGTSASGAVTSAAGP